MSQRSRLRQFAKRVLFGPMSFAQQCPIGLSDPQQEVIVRLHGSGEPRDVTRNHVMASGAPFTIGIGLETQQIQAAKNRPLSLRFCSREDEKLLGSIALQPSAVIPAGPRFLHLFRCRSFKNFCLPKPWLWSRYLHYAYLRSRAPVPDVRPTMRELHSMFVFYICPRPVVLGGVCDGIHSNVFPMNLMGPIGDGYFSFALNSARPVTALVERARSVALSSLPFSQSSVALQLGKNHKVEHIDLAQLPFSTKPSPNSRLPVPDFALRVREIEIEAAHNVGSHTLFIARVIHDDRWAHGPEMFVVHGIYQAARYRAHTELAGESLAT
jgi:flavin reductase (DIM6/NTAB) family NADH-FMN oxidoreductase RutF